MSQKWPKQVIKLYTGQEHILSSETFVTVVTDVIKQLQIMQMNHSSLQKHQGKLFQCVSADYFELKGQHYLSLVDRFSEQIMLFHYLPSKLKNDLLINTFREIFTNYGTLQWCCDVVIITTVQLHSTKPELRFCTGSNPACGMLEICDGEDLCQRSWLKMGLNAFQQSTIPQKQFIIIFIIIIIIILGTTICIPAI